MDSAPVLQWLSRQLKTLILPGALCCAGLTAAVETQPRFELLHLWGSEGEMRALAAYSDAAKQRGVDWSEHIVFFNFLGVRAMFAKRLAISQPPSGIFWIGGNSAKQMIDAGLFRPIPTKLENFDFSKSLLPEVYDAIRYRDMITLVPVGSHIQNRIFYNQDILDELAIEPPRTWSQFLAVAPAVQKAGYYPMIVTDQRWQNRYFFLAILAEKLTADEMRRFLSGNEPVEKYRDAMLASMEVLMALRPYTNKDIGDLSWDAAIGKVYDKSGFAYILGDFTSALIPKDDGTVLCTEPPGNEYVMWAVDGIALTQSDDPLVITGQNILIKVVTDVTNHNNYIANKGGVSAYVGGESIHLDRCTQASKQAWEQIPEKVFVSSEDWTETLDAFATITMTVWRTPDITVEEAVEQTIAALNDSRKRHSKR